MQIRNTALTYGFVARCLHWAVAVLILMLFGLGLYMSRLTVESEAQVDFVFNVFSIHKTLGLTVLVLAILRIVWALAQPHPRPLASHKPVEVLAAQVVHWLLYVLIFAMPLTGWLHHSATQGLAPIWGPFPQRIWFIAQSETVAAFWGWAHYLTAWIMGGLIALHIAGGLKHAIIDKDGTLQRMLKSNGKLAVTSDHNTKDLPKILAVLIVLAFAATVFLTAPATQSHTETAPQASGENASGNWIVDGEQSQLSIEVIQSGNPVQGHFGIWTANIDYDPSSPETANLSVDIDIASLDLGSVSSQAHSANFLNAATFPTANFSAQGFAPQGDGRFEANGELELAGNTLPLMLNFTLDIQGEVATASGSAQINRHDYKIGSDDPLVGSVVTVNFDIQANSSKQ